MQQKHNYETNTMSSWRAFATVNISALQYMCESLLLSKKFLNITSLYPERPSKQGTCYTFFMLGGWEGDKYCSKKSESQIKN
jgi:hypothetical protein